MSDEEEQILHKLKLLRKDIGVYTDGAIRKFIDEIIVEFKELIEYGK